MDTVHVDPDLLTTEEVARLCRVPESTVRQWRYRGTGPKNARIGRGIKYRRSDVVAWMNEQFDGEKEDDGNSVE